MLLCGGGAWSSQLSLSSRPGNSSPQVFWLSRKKDKKVCGGWVIYPDRKCHLGHPGAEGARAGAVIPGDPGLKDKDCPVMPCPASGLDRRVEAGGQLGSGRASGDCSALLSAPVTHTHACAHTHTHTHTHHSTILACSHILSLSLSLTHTCTLKHTFK